MLTPCFCATCTAIPLVCCAALRGRPVNTAARHCVSDKNAARLAKLASSASSYCPLVTGKLTVQRGRVHFRQIGTQKRTDLPGTLEALRAGASPGQHDCPPSSWVHKYGFVVPRLLILGWRSLTQSGPVCVLLFWRWLFFFTMRVA